MERRSHLFLSCIAYLTILVADDRLFTANCCFKLVFVATKVAHRAMTDMLSKGRERERLMMMMRVSGKFDTSRENSERERKRRDAQTNLERRVCLSLSPKKKHNPLSSHFGAVVEAGGRLKRKKDARQKEPTTFI